MQEPTNMEELLDRIEGAVGEDNRISFDEILDQVGHRSFGPLILLAGLVTVMPVIGDIPGMSATMGVFVLLTSGQMLLRRDHFWLPQWLLRRSVAKNKLCKVLGWAQKPARFLDKLLRPRLKLFVNGGGTMAIALVCTVIALFMPAMEFIPFSANGAGLALTAFGLALIGRDGLIAVFALLVTGGTLGLLGYNLLTG